MRILFLDDNPIRCEQARQNCIPHDLTIVTDADQTIKALEQEVFDVVCLDHDLGGPESENVIDYIEKDGRWITKWIGAYTNVFPGYFSKTLFLVHSLNVHAAMLMQDELVNAGLKCVRMPFSWQKSPDFWVNNA